VKTLEQVVKEKIAQGYVWAGENDNDPKNSGWIKPKKRKKRLEKQNTRK
jgi:hypothetical protein